MTKSTARNLFLFGTAISTIIFLYLTVDTLRQIPHRTDEQELTPQVAAGKWVWQKKNCNDCHTILGIGGYYAPDLTKEGSVRPAEWLKKFLKDPKAVMSHPRQMPNQNLSDTDIDNVIAFLQWVSKIDTNNWPPQPMAASAPAGTSPQAAEGRNLMSDFGCFACHTINGAGGKVGPDLTHVGSRRDKQWITLQITDPQSHNPVTTMPAFKNMSPDHVKGIVDYLSQLR